MRPAPSPGVAAVELGSGLGRRLFDRVRIHRRGKCADVVARRVVAPEHRDCVREPGVPERALERDDATIADPGDVNRAKPELRDEPGDVVADLLEGHVAIRVVRPPVATVFNRDDAVALGERRCKTGPAAYRIVDGPARAVQQDKRRRVRIPDLLVVHVQLADPGVGHEGADPTALRQASSRRSPERGLDPRTWERIRVPPDSAATLEPGDLPHDRSVSIGLDKSTLLDDREHPRGRVGECPKLLPLEPEEQILRTQQEA